MFYFPEYWRLIYWILGRVDGIEGIDEIDGIDGIEGIEGIEGIDEIRDWIVESCQCLAFVL